MNYQRDVVQLREVASMFWPEELSREAATLSIIPLLLETQDQFLCILGVGVSSIERLFELIDIADMAPNLFLKHLMILADFGGELLQRINDNFNTLFPTGELNYVWGEQQQIYTFTELPATGRLTNAKVGVSAKKLAREQTLNSLLKDVIALLIFGAAHSDHDTAVILSKCEIGNYIGEPESLKQFVKQRYIWVSRITAGSQSNNLGQLAQRFVKEYIENNLQIEGAHIQTDGNLPGVMHTDAAEGRLTNFDIVISKEGKYVAVEVSFQVTTNSVIHRKEGQVQSRFQQIDGAGYRIAYVIDGAGNFQRENALATICRYSHCTVAFSTTELELLCTFIREYLNDTSF